MRSLGDCFKQENTARNAKIQFLKMLFWIPLIAVIAVILPILRSRRPNPRYRGTVTTAIYSCGWLTVNLLMSKSLYNEITVKKSKLDI